MLYLSVSGGVFTRQETLNNTSVKGRATRECSFNSPNLGFGVAPETLWRTMRPPESKWRHMSLKATINTGNVAQILDALDHHAALDKNDYKKAADAFVASVAPVLAVVSSQRERERERERKKMKRHVRVEAKQASGATVSVISGDRVLVKASQFASTVFFANSSLER